MEVKKEKNRMKTVFLLHQWHADDSVHLTPFCISTHATSQRKICGELGYSFTRAPRVTGEMKLGGEFPSYLKYRIKYFMLHYNPCIMPPVEMKSD